MVQEGFKADMNLPGKLDDKLDELFNAYNLGKETDLVKILGLFSEKLKLLENKEDTPVKKGTSALIALDVSCCDFKDTCYTARFNMGSCPCELRR